MLFISSIEFCLLYLSEIVGDIVVWPMTGNEYFSKQRFQGIMVKN